MPMVQLELDVPSLQSAVTLNPERTAVLVVDLQNESCHPDGKNYVTEEAVNAVAGTAALVERARENGCPVMWTQSVRRRDQPIFSVFGVEPYRIEGTWNVEITAPLKPREDEPVFKKYTHNCFFETGLDAYLAERGIAGPEWTVIATGVSFAGCVYVAATGLSVRDFRVVVPMDCVSPQTGSRALITMSRLMDRSYSYNLTVLDSSAGLQFAR